MSTTQGDGSITGHVRDGDDAPVADAAVMIAGGSPPHPDIAALTDPQGRYRFDGLAPGRYTLQVNAAGYPPQSAGVTVGPGEAARLDFTLPPGPPP